MNEPDHARDRELARKVDECAQALLEAMNAADTAGLHVEASIAITRGENPVTGQSRQWFEVTVEVMRPLL